MNINATADVIRIMGVWVRRADAELARSAARNAAHSVQAERMRELEDARTLRDLLAIPAVDAGIGEQSARRA